jgi:Carbohydrate binding domain
LTGLAAADRLADAEPSAALAADLTAFYIDLQARNREALNNSVANVQAYRRAAADIVRLLAGLPALDAGLLALLAPPSPTAAVTSPVPSSPAPATASPAPATASPATPPPATPQPPSPSPPQASPSGPPASGAPSPGPIAGDQLRDGDFEGDLSAWSLDEATGAAATLSSTTDTPISGTRSARIAIAIAPGTPSGIALVQEGIGITFGDRHVARVFARAETPRDVSLGVVSAFGAVYEEQTFTVGTAWTELRLEFTPLSTDANARFEVGLGESAADVWLDAAAFGSAG